jgi:dephospho-CoA kinase
MRCSRIGLTGGIGSGKSTVAAMLVDAGAALVDTDALARALTAPAGAALPALAQAFGPEVIGADGALDRERMRTLAFGSPQVRGQLEAILHPMIGERARAEGERLGADGRTVVFDVPLLAESGHWRARVERILVVDCEEATQEARVVARSGWSEQAVRRVMAQQAGRAQRRAIADAVIYNEALTLAELRAQVDALWQAWQGRPVEQSPAVR